MMATPLAVAHPMHDTYYADPDPVYESDVYVVDAVPDARGKVYLEATYDPHLGAYVYPERISVTVDPYGPPVTYRAKRIHFNGMTPVVPVDAR